MNRKSTNETETGFYSCYMMVTCLVAVAFVTRSGPYRALFGLVYGIPIGNGMSKRSRYTKNS